MIRELVCFLIDCQTELTLNYFLIKCPETALTRFLQNRSGERQYVAPALPINIQRSHIKCLAIPTCLLEEFLYFCTSLLRDGAFITRSTGLRNCSVVPLYISYGMPAPILATGPSGGHRFDAHEKSHPHQVASLYVFGGGGGG